MREDVEHQPHAPVVGERERIVQDHRGGSALFDEHFGEGKSHEDGDLLLGTHAQMIEVLLVPRTAGHSLDVQLFVHADFGAGKEHLQVGVDVIHDRCKVALPGLAFGGAKCVAE